MINTGIFKNDKHIKYSRADNQFSVAIWPIGTNKKPESKAIPLKGSNYVPVYNPKISTNPGPAVVDKDLLVTPISTNMIITKGLVWAKSL